MTESRRSFWSGWTRAAYSGAAMGLVLLLTGDRARTAVSVGIDPLEILKVQVRPNVLLVLDSSGSMSENLAGGRLSDDARRSKMAIAKRALTTLVDDFEDRANFALLHYNQGALALDESTRNSGDADNGGFKNRFLYTSTDATAATVEVNKGSTAGSSDGFVKRNGCSSVPTTPGDVCGDTIVDADGTAIHRLYTWGLYNGQTISFEAVTGIVCQSVDGPPTSPPTVLMREVTACGGADTANPTETFTFQGVAGDWGNDPLSCAVPGADLRDVNRLNDCTDVDQVTDVAPFLSPALSVSGGVIAGYNDGGAPGTIVWSSGVALPAAPFLLDPCSVAGCAGAPTANGIRAGGFRPLWPTLKGIKDFIFNTAYFGALTSPKPRTHIIFLTDGDDQCPDPSAPPTPDSTDFSDPTVPANDGALRAAFRAQDLFTKTDVADPATGVITHVIGLGSRVHAERLNWISYGGTGLGLPTTGAGDQTRWATIPTATEVNACVSCRSALLAADARELDLALNTAINLSLNQGEFSASPQVIGTIFELTTDSPGTTDVVESPLDPSTRYNQRVNILYQSTFSLPEWEGHLFAFRNDGSFQQVDVSGDATCLAANPAGIWDAGLMLNCKVTDVLRATGGANGVNLFTFAELHGGATVRGIAASSAKLKRRIFTSNGHGTFLRPASGDAHDDAQFDASRTEGSNAVALWPPNQSGLSSGSAGGSFGSSRTAITDVDPLEGTAGPLDAAFGIASLTFSELQAQTAACLASTDSPLPPGHPCLAGGLQQLDAARKEAREVILAYIAGAQIARGTDGEPLRGSGSEMLFQSAGWLLRDTQNSAPAIATPPLRFTPSTHISEFTLYRDGRRDFNGEGIEEVDLGFGLRNPDFDNASPEFDLDLKPVMTVVYQGTNFLLHAFRAGPQCAGGCPGTGEQGSEELWAYLPHDQLGKALLLINQGQVTDPHVYGIAASVRVASIFVPDADGYIINGAPFTGRWRSVLYFGRGPGGSHYTAIDVTAPGAFTKKALETNPPWVMWSRGNPDTEDGLPAGTNNNTVADFNAYDKLGQTWSVPALGNVDPSGMPCASARTPSGAEWRVFFGGGYGDSANPGQGKRFFNIDAITGDVCSTVPMNNGLATYIADNAVPAAPAAYNSRAQDPPGTINHSTSDKVTRVYLGDVHGRMWRFSSTSGGVLYNAGPSQPFGDAVALLKVNNIPVVYAESGNDLRVPLGAGPFKMFALPDEGDETTFLTNNINLPVPPSPSPLPSPIPSPVPASATTWTLAFPANFRGTVQPTTAFNEKNVPRVFFAGTRFNPAGVGSCAATFDTILFAVSGLSGGAVYDFNGGGADLSTLIAGTKTTGIQVVGGSLLVGKSGSLASAPTPTPDPFPTATPPPPKPAYITASDPKTNSPVCRIP